MVPERWPVGHVLADLIRGQFDAVPDLVKVEPAGVSNGGVSIHWSPPFQHGLDSVDVLELGLGG